MHRKELAASPVEKYLEDIYTLYHYLNTKWSEEHIFVCQRARAKKLTLLFHNFGAEESKDSSETL